MDFLLESVIVKAEVATIVTMVVLTIISALASYLLRPKPPLIQDNRPSNEALRGGYIPNVIGRRRVAAKIMWVGDHDTKSESVEGGGKGGGGDQKVKIHYEKSIHALAIGPVTRLHGIYSNGKEIFKGPITPTSHPSGSTVNAGTPGTFHIFWGEEDQGDISAETGIDFATKFGFTSRFPRICYVVWNDKRLGQNRQWTVMDYEIEVRPSAPVGTTITLSEADWIQPTFTAEGSNYSIQSAVNGVPGVNYVEINGTKTKSFPEGGYVRLIGSGEDGDYEIYDVAVISTWHPAPIWNYSYATRIYFAGTMSTLSGAGTIDPIYGNDDDGAQPAHALRQLLFSKYPYGMAMDEDLWDATSFQAFSAVVTSEDVPVNLLADNAEDNIAIIAALMQDIGFLISWSVRLGQYEIVELREPCGSCITTIPAGLIADPLPEIETFHGDHPAQRLVFTFPARRENYKNGTVNQDNDADIALLNRVSPRSVEMPTITGFDAADVVAQRRAQEEFGNLASFTVMGTRECRVLQVGAALAISGISQVVRLLALDMDDETGKVAMETMVDSYGIQASTFVATAGLAHPDPLVVEPDPAINFLELPNYLVQNETRIIVPRIRAHAEITAAYIWISRDDTTYYDVGQEVNIITGGQLDETLAIDSDIFIDEGPEFTVLGPDIGDVSDYSADEENWRLGRQWLVIDQEICFLKKVTAIGGVTYRLDGIIRARFDTVRAAYGIGAPAYIIQWDSIEKFKDLLLQPGKALYVKVQPIAGESIGLADLEPINRTLKGKGIAPMNPANLRTENMRDVFATGADIPLKWSYRSTALPKTGAGMQGAGDPVGQSAVQGEFVLRFYTTGDVLKKELSGLLLRTYTVDNADLVTWFGAEPAAFKVSVVNVNGGVSSDAITITVTRE